MLDVTSAQNFLMSSGWNLGRVFALIAVLVGILALAATVNLLIKHRNVFDEQPDEPDSRTIRTGASTTLQGVLWSGLGVLVIPLCIIHLIESLDGNYTFNFLAMGYFLMGLFFTRSGVNEQIEYNENGIREMQASKLIKSIHWSDLEEVRFRKFGRYVALIGGGTRLWVSLRNPNTPRLLLFISERVTGENLKTIEALLKETPNQKSV